MVDISPSTEIMLKVSVTSARSASCRSSPEIAASVVTKASMVHILGWIMPLPLAMPPTVTVFPESSTVTAACLEWVSVVMMASAASRPASSVSESAPASAFTPSVIRSMGSCIPITPVDATRTESSGIPSASAAACAVCLQYCLPCSPVHALAIPELATTAWTAAFFSTISRSQTTGAAFTTLLVNTPAARHGVRLNTIAMSFLF